MVDNARVIRVNGSETYDAANKPIYLCCRSGWWVGIVGSSAKLGD